MSIKLRLLRISRKWVPVLIGYFVAPLLPAGAIILWAPTDGGALLYTALYYPFFLVFGSVSFILLFRFRKLTFYTVILVSALIGLIPVVAWFYIVGLTASSLPLFFRLAGVLFVAGAVSGAIFWEIALRNSAMLTSQSQRE